MTTMQITDVSWRVLSDEEAAHMRRLRPWRYRYNRTSDIVHITGKVDGREMQVETLIAPALLGDTAVSVDALFTLMFETAAETLAEAGENNA